MKFAQSIPHIATTVAVLLIIGQSFTGTTAANAAESGSFRSCEVKQYIALPDLPQYTGQAVLIHSVQCPEAPGGNTITYVYAAREDRQVVTRWYHDVLRMNQWTLGSRQPQDGVRATKGAASVRVQVTPGSKPGYPSEILVTYQASVLR